MMSPQRNGSPPPRTPGGPQSKPLSPSRMTLDALVRGKRTAPLRVVLYGVEGIGKSTFGANAPAPIFLGAEDGTDHLDVTRFPSPESWQEVLDAVRVLTSEQHDYRTLVVDTLDWAEPLLWAHICKRDQQDNIESYGYGKGYSAALDEWRVFLAALDKLRRQKGMHIILLAHCWIKPFKNPEGDDFDRYELKLNAKASGLVKEWAEHVLFANHETYASKDARTKRVRGISTGARLIYTTRTAAYDAKNRGDLPEFMPLSWADFMAALEAHQPADPKALEAAIREKAEQLPEEHKRNALAAIERAGGDAVKLAKLNDWTNARLGEVT
ncbi:ATP-binding protein [Corallococcus sp. AB030]|uniref:ATP-binding protein n=1 Tax=Corallococcus sp. AB030 TaxID=2316716 RepID=UPI000EC42060|nr:ATP-binding protein [Corallococcus sp. AB030]RKI08309.1 ATP-binding protein [Corallococcus sp. AB030]